MQPRKKRIGERKKMKRTDITNLFPDATDDQINTLMGINGNDINNAKRGFDDLQKSLKSAQDALAQAQASNKENELNDALAQLQAVNGELNTLKANEAIRQTREKVAEATGVPINCLTGETEDECTTQAQAILQFAQPSAYPRMRDGGEVTVTPKKTTRESFAEWFNQFQ